MNENVSPRCLRARWVFPVIGPPLRDAAVTIFQGRITAVGDPPRDLPIEDLGQAAILPGLVNAHTHLEFSNLAAPIGRQGMEFVAWLGSVVRQRTDAPVEGHSPVELGLRESAGQGVTTIGEIAQPGKTIDPYLASPCDGVVFMEMIAPRIDRVATAMESAQRHEGNDSFWQPGLSPHAPYTVHPELLARAVDFAIEHGLPLAMHLAESREEIEFLREGRGPFRELLESRGGWDPAARPPGARPLHELRTLARAPRALVVHGNYLDDEEIEFVGQQRQLAVVYCPRTHAWFGHARYPLEKLLTAGAVVALGTDSRASSPDLSLLAEMRHVARVFPALSRATILELGTLGGARALGLDAQIGALAPGKRANLTVVALPEDAATDPYELLLDGTGAVTATWVRGKRVDCR
jgi:cytosine/adenosine deaminase-related metal-dependent hydrolase